MCVCVYHLIWYAKDECLLDENIIIIILFKQCNLILLVYLCLFVLHLFCFVSCLKKWRIKMLQNCITYERFLLNIYTKYKVTLHKPWITIGKGKIFIFIDLWYNCNNILLLIFNASSCRENNKIYESMQFLVFLQQSNNNNNETLPFYWTLQKYYVLEY